MIATVIILALAGFAVAYLVTMTSGPFMLFTKIRQWLLSKNIRVLECTVCAGVWSVALMLSLLMFGGTIGNNIVIVCASLGLIISIIEWIGRRL